jgi:hypothetical protein
MGPLSQSDFDAKTTAAERRSLTAYVRVDPPGLTAVTEIPARVRARCGTYVAWSPVRVQNDNGPIGEIMPLTWAATVGAGDENRTRTVSLGS